jgi:pilus assembly protein CpaE
MEGSSTIRVLIVDDVDETREIITKLLQYEKDIKVVGSANSGRQGLELTKQLDPDVVIMDINMPDMDGITVSELLRGINDYTQIVILTVQGDSNYMRRAMLAGVRDFLTKPPQIDELIDTVRRAGQVSFEKRSKISSALAAMGTEKVTKALVSRGKVIVVYSPKGGTGNTTIAVNLAVTLHNDQSKVVIVDGNLQFGDVSIFLNLRPRNNLLDLTPRANELDAEIIDDVIMTEDRSGIQLLASPDEPLYFDRVNSTEFTDVINFLRKMFTYIIIDVSSTLTDVALGAIDIADILIVLTNQDIPSIKSSRLFLQLTDEMKIDRSKIFFVMNRYDKRIGITPEKVSNNLNQPIVSVIPLDEQIVIPSVNRGVPFVLNDRSQPTSKCIIELSELIRNKIDEIRELEIQTT